MTTEPKEGHALTDETPAAWKCPKGRDGHTAAGTALWCVALSNVPAAIAPVCGTVVVGCALHCDLGWEPAALPTLAYGATAALLLVATFGLAAIVRPAVRGVTGLGDVETGIIAGGLLVAFVGAFQWNHGAGGWRFTALGFLGWFLFVGWIVSAAGGAWEAAWQDSPFSFVGVAFLALALSGPPFDPNAVRSST